MPYNSISELPSSVRNALPEAAQKIFMHVVNSSLRAGFSEEISFKRAWRQVKRSYRKSAEGKWVSRG